MYRKFLLLLIAILPFLLKSQTSIGDWRIHSVFNDNITSIVESDNKVYYLVDGYLYAYDKNGDGENEAYTKRNILSDIDIKSIHYNYDKKYLIVTYSNSNIDLLKDDGSIVRIPDIYESTTKNKGINDVAFSGNNIYVATDFGYIIIDDTKFEVKTTVNIETAIQNIGIVGSHIVFSTNNLLYSGNINKNNHSLDDFIQSQFHENGKICPLDDNTFLFGPGWLYKVSVQDSGTQYAGSLSQNGVHQIQKTKSGYMFTDNSNVINIIDESGNISSKLPLTDDMKNSYFSSYNNNDSFWEINGSGLRNIKIAEDGGITVLTDFFRPNSSSVKIAYNLVYNNPLKKLYVMNSGANYFLSPYGVLGRISSFDGSYWTDEAPATAPTQNENCNNNRLNDPFSPVFDPENPNTYYIGSWFEGAYKITDGKVVANYNPDNSPIKTYIPNSKTPSFYVNIVPNLAFDKNKNLWMIGYSNTNIMVLPRAKQNLTTVTQSDWITPQVPGLEASQKSKFLITSQDIKIYSEGEYQKPLIVFSDNSNPSSTITSKSYSKLTDQDGAEYNWNYIFCFAEDLNGKVWMGTSNGVVEFNPKNAISSSSFTVNHLKVPRNDGTNYADYLLNETGVTCIAVDGFNRKWIGTQNSGLFLVSSDGSEILKHFTTSNSYLTSNFILSVTCNPNNNSVYVGTTTGLLEYFSDATPGESDFSNVYAYPNPVRPEYTGLITINGLMENSLVKIADASGNVFKTLQSTGGMATWDGCNANGAKVKSGVYYVLSSQNENEKSSGVVTKILIVR